MRRLPIIGSAVVLLPLLASCGGESEPELDVPPAAETGFSPDSLAWFREGRPVRFGDRLWRPVGRPIQEPATSFRVVGEFEGMMLFAVREEAAPYAHLFFPYGNETWQTLEPIEEADTVPAEP